MDKRRMQVVVAGGCFTALPAFIDALEENGAQITCLDSGRETIEAVSSKAFDLLVAAEKLEDMTGLELIETVVVAQPMLNCAVMSSLSSADYHEASEGLGILMQLPLQPGTQEAVRLMDHLKKIQSFKVGS